MPAWLIWVIVIVVVVVIAAALVSMARKRRTEKRQERAEQLREEAGTHAAALPESQREAEELRAKADLAKSEAQRAEERAANAEQGHRVEQASYEDKLREADRLDPAVDHKSGDYQPDVWNDEGSESTATSETPPASSADATHPKAEVTSPTSSSGRPVASPDETSVAQRTEDPEAESASPASESRRKAT